jgi:hypothetical protein
MAPLMMCWIRYGLLLACWAAGAATGAPPGDSSEPAVGEFQSAEMPPFCYEIAKRWSDVWMVDLNDASQLLFRKIHGRLQFMQSFVYQEGNFTNVGWHLYADSTAQAINDQGTVVGYFYLYDPLTNYPYIWEDGRSQFISRAQVPSNRIAQFYAINNHGDAVGKADVQGELGTELHVVLAKRQANGSYEMIDISPPTTPGMRRCDRAYDINDAGVAVAVLLETASQCGNYSLAQAAISINEPDGGIQGFDLLPQFPGADPNAPSWASAINDLGEVVGWAVDHDGRGKVVLWKKGIVHDLSEQIGEGRGCVPLDINNRGEILGVTSVAHGVGFQYHPCLIADGQMWDLNDLLCTPLEEGSYLSWPPLKINDASEVIGLGIISDDCDVKFGCAEFGFYAVPRVRAVPKTRK